MCYLITTSTGSRYLPFEGPPNKGKAMKKYVLGFHQDKLLEYNLDLTDATILRWFFDFIKSGNMESINKDGKDFYYVSYLKINTDVPIIGIQSRTPFYRRFEKYIKTGLVEKHFDEKKSKVFFRPTEKLNEILFIPVAHEQHPPVVEEQHPVENSINTGCSKTTPLLLENNTPCISSATPPVAREQHNISSINISSNDNLEEPRERPKTKTLDYLLENDVIVKITDQFILNIKSNPTLRGYHSKLPDKNSHLYKKWLYQIDNIIRLDGMNQSDLEKIIEMLKDHPFWTKNVISAETLRKQFPKLLTELETRQKKGVVYGLSRQNYGESTDPHIRRLMQNDF